MSLFSSKNKLKAERDQAKQACQAMTNEAGRMLAEKDRQISLLKYKSKLPGIQLSDMTERAKKRLSRYEVSVVRAENYCKACTECEQRINSSNMRMHYCTRHDHRVNSYKGSCPSHSNIIEQVA